MAKDDVQLALARAAKATRDPEALVGALVDAWRGGRAAELATLVEEAGRRVTRPALAVKPAAAATKAWKACLKSGDAADVDRLCTAATSATVAQMIEGFESLAKQPADPRIARMALRVFENQPVRSKAARGIYPAATALIVAMQDPRSAAIVADVKKHKMPGLGLEGGVDFRDYFTKQVARLEKAVAAIPPAIPLADKSTTLVNTIADALAATGTAERNADTNEHALLAAIWAAPDDDGPRQVYADFLQERGEPHGEFITLQLADHRGALDKAGRTRMRALQKAHARTFFGPLAPAVTLTNLRFERGFVAHCELADKVSPEIKALENHPAWSTVKSFFAWTGRKIYPAMIAHLKKLGAKGFYERPAYLKKLPPA
jgi:uncharacterized protein (TIGR02996 family)